ncbi:MAG: DUF6338 family protein [Bacteroidota bacterium]|nr:DUF6338 family protein [Bacteroidota bacterium]
MELFNLENIGLFICFFLPGFIAVKTFHLLVPTDRIDVTNSVLEIIGFSCLNLFLFSWIILINIHFGWIYMYNFYFIISVFVVLFIGPILLAYSYFKISRSKYFSKIAIDKSGTPWDNFFELRKNCFVVVTYNNNTQVGGYYGTLSRASVYPKPHQLYLEQVWILGEKNSFIKRKSQTFGCILNLTEVKIIEFYR